MCNKIMIFVLAAIMLAACSSDLKFDASSLETSKESVNRLKSALPESQRPEFEKAIQTILPGKSQASDPASELTEMSEEVRLSLDGKNAAQIIAEASRVKNERERQAQSLEKQELETLEAKYKSFIEAGEQLSRFKVLSSRFYFIKNDMQEAKPVIEMKVKNETSFAVYSVHFECGLTGLGTQTNAERAKLQYDIPGGLQPGQMSNWHFSPDAFSDWSNVKVSKRSGLNISIIRIDGPAGNSLFAAQELSEQDVKRLAELKQKYGR